MARGGGRLAVVSALVLMGALVGACGQPQAGAVSTATPVAKAAAGAAQGTGQAGQAAGAAATPRPGQAGRMVKAGDTISVHYTGTLDDGKQFDSSRGREPLSFTVGAGQMIAGFDRAVVGMEVGKTVKVRMEAKDAYGDRRDDLIVKVPAAQAPQGLQVGQRVALGGRPAVVTAVTPETVTVDANHELAGQALNFEIELVSIN